MSYPHPDPTDPRVAKAIRKATRPWYQKKRFLVPLVLLALVFVSTIFGASGSDPAPAGAPGPTPTVVTSAPVDTAPDFTATTYGQTADSDGLKLTVSAPKTVKDPLGTYYCTTVTYENNTGDQVSFNTFDWKLADTEGVEVSPTFGGTTNTLGSGELRPGGRKTGDVCFDKQGSGTPQGVTYRGGMFDAPVQWQAN